MSANPLMKPSGARTVVIISAIAVVIAGLSAFLALNPPGGKPKADATQSSAQSSDKDPVGGIGALGRLEPEGDVFKIAPPAVGFSSRVAKVLVKEGDRVKAGQPIAVMDNFDSLRAAGMQAEAQVREAEAKLDQIKAGAKVGDVNAQRATVAQAETTLSQAQAEAAEAELAFESARAELSKRQWDLEKAAALCQLDKPDISEADSLSKGTTVCNNGAISEAEIRSRALAVATQQKQVAQSLKVVEQRRQAAERAGLQIAEAGQRLNSVAEVRPTDVRQAEEQVRSAIANVQRAKADFDNAIVKSPIDGQILKIHTKDNEAVGTNGLMEIGRTSQMYAIAEVDENLVSRVKEGQRAIVKSDAFPGEITGKVVQIGRKVGKNEITSTDPADAQDARVVEVKIKLDSSEIVAGLTKLQVKVAIQP